MQGGHARRSLCSIDWPKVKTNKDRTFEAQPLSQGENMWANFFKRCWAVASGSRRELLQHNDLNLENVVKSILKHSTPEPGVTKGEKMQKIP